MQFSRLLCAMDAVGFFDDDDPRIDELLARVCYALELHPTDVDDILHRAVSTWTTIERRSLLRRRRTHWWSVTLGLMLWAALVAPANLYSWSCLQEDSARARIGTSAVGCIWWGPLQGNGEHRTIWNRPPVAR